MKILKMFVYVKGNELAPQTFNSVEEYVNANLDKLSISAINILYDDGLIENWECN